jgi:hypothetical protein
MYIHSDAAIGVRVREFSCTPSCLEMPATSRGCVPFSQVFTGPGIQGPHSRQGTPGVMQSAVSGDFPKHPDSWNDSSARAGAASHPRQQAQPEVDHWQRACSLCPGWPAICSESVSFATAPAHRLCGNMDQIDIIRSAGFHPSWSERTSRETVYPMWCGPSYDELSDEEDTLGYPAPYDSRDVADPVPGQRSYVADNPEALTQKTSLAAHPFLATGLHIMPRYGPGPPEVCISINRVPNCTSFGEGERLYALFQAASRAFGDNLVRPIRMVDERFQPGMFTPAACDIIRSDSFAASPAGESFASDGLKYPEDMSWLDSSDRWRSDRYPTSSVRSTAEVVDAHGSSVEGTGFSENRSPLRLPSSQSVLPISYGTTGESYSVMISGNVARPASYHYNRLPSYR